MADGQVEGPQEVTDADVPLDRDGYLRSVLRGLSGTLEEVVGVDEAAGFISVVGDRIGRALDVDYRRALATEALTREQVAAVLVDLMRRVGGDFYVIEQEDDRIVLGNRACPFGEKVLGRPSLCMMTSNMFGAIAAENLGYARVDIQEAIAQGAPGCRVIVDLATSTDTGPARGREYFRSGPEPLPTDADPR